MVKVEEIEDCRNTTTLNGGDDVIQTPEYNPNVVKKEVGSSSSMMKSNLVGMGFSPALVDKVIEENGEGDFNLLLDTLFTQSAIVNSTSEVLCHNNGTVGACDISEDDSESCFDVSSFDSEEFEDNTPNDVMSEKKSSLLKMNFSKEDIDLAISRLGPDASFMELIDFITAIQISGKAGENTNITAVTTETLFTTMDKTLQLLQMGFNEQEISTVMDNYDSRTSVCELADLIFASRNANRGFIKKEDSDGWKSKYDASWNYSSQTEKLPKREFSTTKVWESKSSKPLTSFPYNCNEMERWKKPKYMLDRPSVYPSNHWESKSLCSFSSNNGRHCPSKPPYFFFGNVVDISYETWKKLSRFLYEKEPELVNSQFFSAFIRKEGYLHNLPTENRSHIVPGGPPMTIEDALPHTKRWWPSWDTRKQLSCLMSETAGLGSLCERLGRIMASSKGILSKEEQTDILHQCKTMNLLWIGENKLKPVDPNQVEHILGYPPTHTDAISYVEGVADRMKLLKHAFQIDTVGYHLSSLKSLYPDGIRVISIFGVIGGAELALARLGIRLRCVISIETSKPSWEILKKWWQNSEQTGQLRPIEDVQKFSLQMIENVVDEFGGIDLVIAGSPLDDFSNIDISMFLEFVRVFQRVKTIMDRRNR